MKHKETRNYETMIIWDTKLNTEELDNEISRLKDIIDKNNGKVLEIDRWGKRRLAYEIKKKSEGIYVIINFNGQPEILENLSEHFKFDENVIRHMTINKGEAAPVEKKPETTTTTTATATEEVDTSEPNEQEEAVSENNEKE